MNLERHFMFGLSELVYIRVKLRSCSGLLINKVFTILIKSSLFGYIIDSQLLFSLQPLRVTKVYKY